MLRLELSVDVRHTLNSKNLSVSVDTNTGCEGFWCTQRKETSLVVVVRTSKRCT